MIVIDPTKVAGNPPWAHLCEPGAKLDLTEDQVRACIEWVLAHPLPGGVEDIRLS